MSSARVIIAVQVFENPRLPVRCSRCAEIPSKTVVGTLYIPNMVPTLESTSFEVDLYCQHHITSKNKN
jgi:hypothetical protein